MRVFRLLPGIDQKRPLVKRLERRPGQRLRPAGSQLHNSRLIMILHTAHLDRMRRINALLIPQSGRISADSPRIAHGRIPNRPNIIIIREIKRLVNLPIRLRHQAAPPPVNNKRRMRRLRQPDHPWLHGRHLPPRPLPKRHRHNRSHITTKTIHPHLRPLAQRFNLVIPQRRIIIDQINDVAPLRNRHIRPPRLITMIPLRVIVQQHAIMGGVVIYHINHHLQPQRMSIATQLLKLFKRPILRVHRPIILDRIRAAQISLLVQLSNRVDRHKPDHIHP